MTRRSQPGWPELTAVRCGVRAPRYYAVATLSGHPLLTLSLSAGSLVALVVLAFLTRAFTIGTAPVLGTLGMSLLVATVAVVAAVALVLLVLLVVICLLLLIVSLLVR